MNSIKFLLIITSMITFVTGSEGHDLSLLEAEVGQLKAMMREQQQIIQEQEAKIQELQQRNIMVDTEKNVNVQIFDCYSTEIWYTTGIITFNGCSVDTTTMDPWKGFFTIQDAGIYRFTFEGSVGIPPSASVDPYGLLGLYVDDKVVASAFLQENQNTETLRYFMVSLNTLQALEVGQNVSIYWSKKDDLFLNSNSNTFVHFTGHNVASSMLVPPQCEYTGQTFEYPGSCRKYYLCLADGTIELSNCCPNGVFDPIGETCIPELSDGSDLCNDDDTC